MKKNSNDTVAIASAVNHVVDSQQEALDRLITEDLGDNVRATQIGTSIILIIDASRIRGLTQGDQVSVARLTSKKFSGVTVRGLSAYRAPRKGEVEILHKHGFKAPERREPEKPESLGEASEASVLGALLPRAV